ncbi:MAG: hypothetical protein ACXWMO_13050, partial [Syntrophales bacterium]
MGVLSLMALTMSTNAFPKMSINDFYVTDKNGLLCYPRGHVPLGNTSVKIGFVPWEEKCYDLGRST